MPNSAVSSYSWHMGKCFHLKFQSTALASVAQLVGALSLNQKVVGFSPHSRHVRSPVWVRAEGSRSMLLSCINVSLSLPSSLSRSNERSVLTWGLKINKLKEKEIKIKIVFTFMHLIQYSDTRGQKYSGERVLNFSKPFPRIATKWLK